MTDIPPDDPEEMLESIRLLMEQCQRQRDAIEAVLNWYGNDRLIAFPGKQLTEALERPPEQLIKSHRPEAK